MASDFNLAIAKCVGTLWMAFRRQEGPQPPVEFFKIYEIGLDGLAPAQIEKATGRALRECKFFPAPAELRELGGVHTWSLVEKAERAYTIADHAARKLHHTATVNFDDNGITNAVIRSLGDWEFWSTMPVEDGYGNSLLAKQKKDFIDAYVRKAQCGVGAGEGAPLMGEVDRVNGFNGFEQGEPKLIATGIPGAKPLQIGSRKPSPQLLNTNWTKKPD